MILKKPGAELHATKKKDKMWFMNPDRLDTKQKDFQEQRLTAQTL